MHRVLEGAKEFADQELWVEGLLEPVEDSEYWRQADFGEPGGMHWLPPLFLWHWPKAERKGADNYASRLGVVAPGEGASRLNLRALESWRDKRVVVAGTVISPVGWPGCLIQPLQIDLLKNWQRAADGLA